MPSIGYYCSQRGENSEVYGQGSRRQHQIFPKVLSVTCCLFVCFKVGINPVSRQNFQLLYLLNKNSECGKVYIFGKDVSQRIHLQNQISQKNHQFLNFDQKCEFLAQNFLYSITNSYLGKKC